MRSLALLLTPAQLRALAKRLDGRLLTDEEQRLLKTVRWRLDQMVEGLNLAGKA